MIIVISIIVPYWNAEKWIGRCIGSLKAQIGNLEVLLVDDHSTDNSRQIAEDLADGRFVLLTNEHSKGVSGARNTGLDHASGSWITFLDADDELLPEAYDNWLKVIRSADANIHQLNHMRYYAAKNKTVMKYWNKGGWYDLANPPEAWFGVWNKLYRAEFVKDVRFDESMSYGEDGMFNLMCFRKDGRIHHGEKSMTAVLHRFENKDSLSHVKTVPDMIKQIHRYEDFMLEQTDPQLRVFMCKELSRLWGSKVFEKVVNGG